MATRSRHTKLLACVGSQFYREANYMNVPVGFSLTWLETLCCPAGGIGIVKTSTRKIAQSRECAAQRMPARLVASSLGSNLALWLEDKATRTVGDLPEDMSSAPQTGETDDAMESCVAAALMDLTEMMGVPYGGIERHYEFFLHCLTLLHSSQVVQVHANAVGEITQEMRNCSKIVEACLEAFVRPKKANNPTVTAECYAGEKPAREANTAMSTSQEAQTRTTPTADHRNRKSEKHPCFRSDLYRNGLMTPS
ncbi:hypothetical protein PIB30_081152 [Stylosanthes scabra]|uniref:Uncharacterized protein n=1 Tax=Stylosanthes scabra TaxID=79078 RepID=A0ABU6WPV7_9FABA|nr:hypothetical protein [Stylosanthes scabra]